MGAIGTVNLAANAVLNLNTNNSTSFSASVVNLAGNATMNAGSGTVGQINGGASTLTVNGGPLRITGNVTAGQFNANTTLTFQPTSGTAMVNTPILASGAVTVKAGTTANMSMNVLTTLDGQIAPGGLRGTFYTQVVSNITNAGTGSYGTDYNVYNTAYNAMTPAATGFASQIQYTSVDGNGYSENTSLISGIALNSAGFKTQTSARWDGAVYIPTTTTVTFYTGSDDGSVLYVDQNLVGSGATNWQRVVNNDYDQGTTYRNGTITLAAGWHDLSMGFYQHGGGGNAYLDYNIGAGEVRIPSSALESASVAPLTIESARASSAAGWSMYP